MDVSLDQCAGGASGSDPRGRQETLSRVQNDFYSKSIVFLVVARKSSKSGRIRTMGGGLSKKKFSKEEKMLKMVSCPNV